MKGNKKNERGPCFGQNREGRFRRMDASHPDRRKILLTLTDAGRADVEAFQMSRKMQHTKDFDVLTQEEQQQLSQLLEKLLDSWSAPRENEP